MVYATIIGYLPIQLVGVTMWNYHRRDIPLWQHAAVLTDLFVIYHLATISLAALSPEANVWKLFVNYTAEQLSP